ncbi:Na+/H+ antiporter NhaA [Rhodobacter sp. NSM]|uniref:Na+/H+ antiporter NhaA n=1 Tax=Rhodobacter sp. NSM TaxID=3457501 RepID=UPI003FD2A074
MYRVSPFLRSFGLALVAGILLALLWANARPESYHDAIDLRLADLPLPAWLAPAGVTVTPASLVGDLLMAPFLFLLGKELWEAMVLRRGTLRGPRAGAVLVTMASGMAGAVLAWQILTLAFQTAAEAESFGGWPVPLGGDAVLAWLGGRIVFGPRHPALHMLLLMTVGADILALVLLALAGWQDLRPLWLLMPLAAALAAWAGAGRLAQSAGSERQRRRAMRLWPYLLAAPFSWIGVAASGLPPILGLLPILPVIPHANHAFGIFSEAEEALADPLNRLAHLCIAPATMALFLFGLTRGGIEPAAVGPTTGILLGALWLGKPLGILAGGLVLAPLLGLRLPAGMRKGHLLPLALISGAGFAVPALALERALPGGAMQEAARLGLALSFLVVPAAFALLRMRRAGLDSRRT